MPVYTLDVILRSNTTATSQTDFRNGTWDLLAPGYSTLTISDDDNLGLGDNSPLTETAATAQVTHIDGVAISPSHPLANGIFAKFVRTDDGDGDTDSLADVVVLGGSGSVNQSEAMIAYPGSNWSMNVGDTFVGSGTKIPSDHPGGRSWSTEEDLGGTPVTPPCFTPGSLIQSKRGLIDISELTAEDLVVTRDNGLQPVKWIYSSPLNTRWFMSNRDLCPIEIKAGALGDGKPNRDMLVSPGHTILVKDGGKEVLVPAKHLRSRDGIRQVKPTDTGYIHLLFEKHQVLMVDGAWSESFQPSLGSLAGIGEMARSELFRIFPEMAYMDGLKRYGPAREVLYRKAAKRVVERFGKTGTFQ